MLVRKNVFVFYCNWIADPHDKIGLCICDARAWCFWFNSAARSHGHGQLAISAGEHSALPKNCFLDLSGVKVLNQTERSAANDRGQISQALATKILMALSTPIKLLPETHRQLAIANLQ